MKTGFRKLLVILLAVALACSVMPAASVGATDPVPACGEYLLWDNGTSRMEMTEDALGLAFRFTLSGVFHVTMDDNHTIDLSGATVCALSEDSACRLVAVGAIVSNDPNVGLRPGGMTRDHLSAKTKDVPAVYATEIVKGGWSEDVGLCYLRYAVRVTNIPWEHSETVVYARPYYVYECDGTEGVIYGAVYSTNYDDNLNMNDGIFDW